MLLVAFALCACDPPHFVSDDAGPRMVGVQPPPRTTRPDGDALPPTVFVLREVSLLDDGSRGWDLDARCTYPPMSPATEWEHECAPTNAMGNHVRDLPGCRDDAYATEVAATFGPLGAGLEAALRQSMNDGVGPLLVRITEWTGDPDDPNVVVEIAPVAFGVPLGGVRGDLVLWDGQDTFNTFAGSVAMDGLALLRDEAAYVAQGVLVARFEEDPVFSMRGRDRSLTLRLTEALLTMRIGGDGDGPSDIALTGRWPVDDVLAELDAAGLCRGDPLRVAAEIRVRDSADVRERSRGGAGMDAACEALSISLGFEAAPGLWGDVLEPDTPPPRACPVMP